MNKNSLPVVDALLLFIAIIWAVNFTVIKIALIEIPHFAFNTLRFIGSSFFFILYYHFYIKDYGFIKRHFWRLVILGLLGNTILQTLFIKGLSLTTASNSSLMYATVPLFVAILSVSMKYEKVRALTWGGILISFSGIFLILSNSSSGIELTKNNLTGDILILITAFLWSVFTVFAKPLMEETSMIKVVSVTFVFGTVFLIPTAIPDFVSMDWASVSIKSWGLLFFSFFFANVVGYTVWFYAVSKVGNIQTAIFQNLVPVMAVIVAMIFLKETVNTQQMVGGAGILGGVLITRLTLKSNAGKSRDDGQ